ncbi:PEP-CTERM sorting domain-containing protein [Sphingomonas pokkalii]|uniref:PEP-CTERM protein-sorting domain-containing protein n=1 Tax=Sphingomonas pokkalii TaxID=2175090 RepID=A0A2U0SDI1_9SPHN|nr:PEP-CTERM sorting domain-containing protein [Sphingomonas pokkalii]PVX29442.1 hypothetical protein DD559_09040 [Sphingomonas pokkalii]
MRARKRRLLLTVAIIAPLFITTSAGIAVAPVSAAVDALSVLAARSPGVRAEGAFSTKRLRLLPLADADALSGSEVLANLPPAIGTPLAPLPAAVPLPADTMPAGEAMMPPPAFAQIPYVALADGPPGGAGPSGSNGGGQGLAPSPVFPGGGGSGGGGGGGGIIVAPTPTPTPPTPPPPIPPISAVPEPASWVLMLVAFPMIGAMVRRRNRRLAAA